VRKFTANNGLLLNRWITAAICGCPEKCALDPSVEGVFMPTWLVSSLVGAAAVLSAVSTFSQQPPPPGSMAQQTLASTLDSSSRPTTTADSTANTSVAADPPAAVATTQQPKRGFVESWSKRVSDTLSNQPNWAIPLVTASSGLLEVVRYDIVRQV